MHFPLLTTMTVTRTIQATLLRYHTEIQQALRQTVQRHSANVFPNQARGNPLNAFYGQMEYHMGWVDRDFAPGNGQTGKLLRPTLLLLAYEAVGAEGLPERATYLRRALPAAVAIELTHNFTLIHDDIVDHDVERHHQPTLWSVWGSSHGINTGDGMFALARMSMWDMLAEGVTGEIATQMAAVMDRATLIIAEGQYLDLSFEQRLDISVAMYLDMISRKTAALMSCAAEMGAILGTRDETVIKHLRDFGFEIGVAFQIRDDVLGIWANAAETGKTSAGDIYRRKKSLPILYALEHADADDQHTLQQSYTQEAPMTQEQVTTVLEILTRTRSREYCFDFLNQRCAQARHVLHSIPHLANATTSQVIEDMEALIHFMEITTHI